MRRRCRSGFVRLWGWPIALTLSTFAGLLGALIGGDGGWRPLAWLALAAPLLVIVHHLLAHRHDNRVVTGYAPPAHARISALLGTAAVYGIALAIAFLSWTRFDLPSKPPAPAALSIFTVAAPAEAPIDKPKSHQPVAAPPEKPSPRSAAPAQVALMPTPPISPPLAPPAVTIVPPAPMMPEPPPPKSMPAPAPQLSSNAPDSWEGRVLAQLGKYRRYPRDALFRREQGVPYIRFVMDRSGKVLSSRLERSAGFPALDREAVALPKRAEPLPRPPADKPGDTIELVVPVEFYTR